MYVNITRTTEYSLSVDDDDMPMLQAIRDKLTELGVEGDTLTELLDTVYSQDIGPALSWLAEQGDVDDDSWVCDSLDADDVDDDAVHLSYTRT